MYDDRRFTTMYDTINREIRRFKVRGQPYYVYYSPDMAIQAHDHNYILRLLSDRTAQQIPQAFSLLPQYRSVETR